ncbi:MAG: magnesium transporter CorA family protein [Pseudomonadota bacterium]
MITAYIPSEAGLLPVQCEKTHVIPPQTIWLDVHAAGPEEVRSAEQFLGFKLPTRDEMGEIETSSRIYTKEGRSYLTVLALVNSETDAPDTLDLTFILMRDRLVTIRYANPRPFTIYTVRAAIAGESVREPAYVLIGILEAFIDRLADTLERAGGEIDGVAQDVFHGTRIRPIQPAELREVVRRIGRAGHLAAKTRESLATIVRVLIQLGTMLPEKHHGTETRAHLKTAVRDCQQLVDHSSYLSNRTGFLMDAMTGLISIEQNNIIKLFSVAAVALMPPTLIASVYGMNFEHMPELSHPLAYPIVVGAMIVSSILPYLFFRRKGWL